MMGSGRPKEEVQSWHVLQLVYLLPLVIVCHSTRVQRVIMLCCAIADFEIIAPPASPRITPRDKRRTQAVSSSWRSINQGSVPDPHLGIWAPWLRSYSPIP